MKWPQGGPLTSQSACNGVGSLCRSMPSLRRPEPPRRPLLLRLTGLCAALLLGGALPGLAQQASLLDSIKQNPQRGQVLCGQLRQLNAQGISFTSSQVTTMVSAQQGLSPADSEVLVTYAVGLYCPDVR